MFFKWYDPILEFFYKIIISLVSSFYSLIGYLYQIFNVLIRTRIFTSDDYLGILNKVYLVLGIVVLFVLAYNFLLLVIDPDKNKGGKVVEKFLKDLVISLALMSFVPTIFDFAFDFEASIITKSSIQRIFASKNTPISSDSLIVGGREMAMGVFDSFFYQIDPETGERKYQQEDEDTPASSENNAGVTIGTALGVVKQEVTEDGEFGRFRAFAKNIVNDEVNFDWLLALIAGGYFVYIMLNYCFDMAVRVMKLAFFQIVAPIAIACRMIPSKEGVFKNWYSKTIKTYTSSFIRIFILSMTVYVFQILGNNLKSSNFWGSDVDMSFGVKGFAYALLILGIVTFIKQVPQLIDELFGLNADIKLGLRDKVKAAAPPGKIFTAAAMVGGAATAGVRNLTHTWKKIGNDFKDAKNEKLSPKDRAKAAVRMLGHGIGGIFNAASGTVSGGINASWYAADAKSRKDVAAATNKATQKVEEKRDKRESYIANRMSKGASFPGALIGFHTLRHLGNAGESFKDWATGGAEQYEKATKSGKNMKQYGDAIDAAAEKLVNQNLSSSDLIQGTAADQKFYGSTEDVDRQIALFDKLRKATGRSFSIAQLEKFREQLANSEITKESFQRYDEERKPMLSDKQLEEEFQKALLQRSKTLDDLERMSVKLRKNAKNHIVDHRNDSDGFAGIEHKDFLDVRASVDSFVLAYNMEGGTITDTETGERFGMLSKDKANISKDIKNVRDAYDHNASRARADQAKREQQKEANK